MNNINQKLSPEQREDLLKTLKARFEINMNHHEGLEWAKVQAKLDADTEKLWSLNEMERTGGEPDVVGYDKKTGEYVFYDCSAESPNGRRSVCKSGGIAGNFGGSGVDLRPLGTLRMKICSATKN
jgi:hypothetical protein